MSDRSSGVVGNLNGGTFGQASAIAQVSSLWFGIAAKSAPSVCVCVCMCSDIGAQVRSRGNLR